MRRARGQRIPIPSAVPRRAGKWDVEHVTSGVSVDIGKRKMLVDTRNTHDARMGRIHEMIHTEISPDKPYGGPDMHPAVVQVVEDHRVWLHAQRAGFYEETQQSCASASDLEDWTNGAADASIDPRKVAEGAIAWGPLYDGERFEAAIQDGIDQCPDDRAKALYRRALKFRDTTRSLFDADYLRDDESTARIAKILTPLYNALADPSPDNHNPGDMDDPSDEEVDKGTERITDTYRSSDGWCPMEVRYPPLPIPHPGKWKTQIRKAKKTGSVPVNMHRYCTDRRIFNVIRKGDAQPTVLGDGSGSMTWSTDEIREVARRFPYAKVAIYRGDGIKGWLSVIVDRCRMALVEQVRGLTGGYNSCDGPALEWLAKQNGPRVWICDGAVNGKRGGTNKRMVSECKALCQTHRILMVPDLESAVDFLERQRGKLRRA